MTEVGSSVPRRRRALRALLLGAALGLVLPAVVALVHAEPAGAATCGPAPAGKTAVALVIDRGSGTPSHHCVVVDERATGMDVLIAAGVGVRQEMGFVCGIGGLPAPPECATRSPSLPSWSYWHAAPDGNWTFSQAGAGFRRLEGRCAVEGWSFGAPGAKQPPRVRPPAVQCDARPAPSPTKPAPAPAPPPAQAPAAQSGGGGAPGGGAPAGGRAPDAGDIRPAPSDTPGPGPDAGGSGEPEHRAEADGDASTEDGAGLDPDVSGDATGGAEPDEGEEAVSGERAGDSRGAESTEESMATTQTGVRSESSGGTPWLGALIAAVGVAGLAGGAVVRSRRNRGA